MRAGGGSGKSSGGQKEWSGVLMRSHNKRDEPPAGRVGRSLKPDPTSSFSSLPTPEERARAKKKPLLPAACVLRAWQTELDCELDCELNW